MNEELSGFQQALDEHLTAINENTAEIQVLFDYLQDLELKIDRLSRRLEQFELLQGPPEKPEIVSLTQYEKEIFLILYTEKEPHTIQEIAKKIQLSPARVGESIAALGRKGIPLQRAFVDEQFFFSLDKQFKERQAKENIVNLSLQSFM